MYTVLRSILLKHQSGPKRISTAAREIFSKAFGKKSPGREYNIG